MLGLANPNPNPNPALLGGGDLRLQALVDGGLEGLQVVLQVGEELECRLPLQAVALLAARHEREALRLDRHRRLLHVLADVPG